MDDACRRPPAAQPSSLDGGGDGAEEPEPDASSVAEDLLGLVCAVARDAQQGDALAEAPRLRLLLAAFRAGMQDFKGGHYRVAVGCAQVRRAEGRGTTTMHGAQGRCSIPPLRTCTFSKPSKPALHPAESHAGQACIRLNGPRDPSPPQPSLPGAGCQVLYHLSRRQHLLPAVCGPDIAGPLAHLLERGVDYGACGSAKAAQVVHGAWCAAGLLCEVRRLRVGVGVCASVCGSLCGGGGVGGLGSLPIAPPRIAARASWRV